MGIVDVDINMSVEEVAVMGSDQGIGGEYGATESSDILGKVEKFLKEGFNFDDSMYLFSIVVTCLIVVITIFLFALRRKSFKGNNLLLLGLSSSGKTLLFCKLILKQHKDTYVSIKENRGVFLTSDDKVTKSINILDLPGQENIRLKFFDQFKDSAKGIIFVLDSSTFQKEVKDVAEFLHTILVSLNGYQLPFLIACNKQDVELAKSANLIKSALEKELNHVRHTHSAALQGVDGKSVSQVQLGNPRKEFAFSDLKNISIQFVEFSAKQDDPDCLLPIKKWIHDL